MLNSGEKIRALRDKKKYSNSCVVRKKNSERSKKTYPPPPPPFQVKWSVPYMTKTLNQIFFSSTKIRIFF